MRAAATTAAGLWTLDLTASSASFTAHQMWLAVRGTVPFRSAHAEIGPAGELLGASAALDLAAIDTGNARRERDLAKPALLDLGAHPTLTVKVGPGRRTADGWTSSATIGARGAVCPVDLTITVGEPETSGRLPVTITAVLDRTPLGLRVPRFAIGRWVQIEVTAVFTRP